MDSIELIESVLAEYRGARVDDYEQLYSGNSRVYKVDTDLGSFLIKIYPGMSEQDRRDRLGVEFEALKYLRASGIECVPEPLHKDVGRNIGVYEFVDAVRVGPGSVRADEVRLVTRFASQLGALAQRTPYEALSNASEACFSYSGYLNNVQCRFKAFDGLGNVTPVHQVMFEFLNDKLLDALSLVSQRTEDPGCDLDPRGATLSPSDFGFHNALRRVDGGLCFVDFEYFGWDDPVKLISDFLLHPAHVLSSENKAQFLEEILDVFRESENLTSRLSAIYPILGLKWCLILLNEFLPASLERRKAARAEIQMDASISDALVQDMLIDQLNKAKAMFLDIEPALTQSNFCFGEIFSGISA